MRVKSSNHPYTRTASGIILFNEEGKVLVVTSLKGPYTVLPKGGVEPELTALENAHKELAEEAGYACTSSTSDLVWDQIIEYGPSHNPERAQRELFYLGVDPVEVRWDEEGMRERHWLEVGEAALRLSTVQTYIMYLAQSQLQRKNYKRGEKCLIH